MKYLVAGIVFAAVFFAAGPNCGAGNTNSGAATGPTPYPLDYCVVSGDKLGSMGPPVRFIYEDKAKGINQEIKFCCPMCKGQFLKNPDKYMKIIENSEARGGKNARTAK